MVFLNVNHHLGNMFSVFFPKHLKDIFIHPSESRWLATPKFGGDLEGP